MIKPGDLRVYVDDEYREIYVIIGVSNPNIYFLHIDAKKQTSFYINHFKICANGSTDAYFYERCDKCFPLKE